MPEYARTGLTVAQFHASIGARSKQNVLQRIVRSRKVESDAPSRSPWQWNVRTRCGQTLRNAAVKFERPFMELDVCAKCEAA